MTEYDARFKGEMVPPPASYKPHTGFRLPETEMEKTSTQHADYVEKPLVKVENYKPKRAYEEPTDAMDLNSTYNTVYLGNISYAILQTEKVRLYKFMIQRSLERLKNILSTFTKYFCDINQF